MKSVMKPIRLNPDKEKELYEFIQERGPKPAVRFLFEFYKNNKNIVDNIVDKLKQEIDFSKPKTVLQAKEIGSEFNFKDDFINNF